MSLFGNLVAFVATVDLDRSRQFYRATLGLELTMSTPYADSYDVKGTELRVTLVQEKTTAPYTVLGWDVADLDEVVERMRAGGVTFNRYDAMEQDSHDAWTAPDGTRVAWFVDPDGNVLSVHQRD